MNWKNNFEIDDYDLIDVKQSFTLDNSLLLVSLRPISAAKL